MHYARLGLIPAVTAENPLSCHTQSQLIHLPRFRTVAVPHALGPRPGCKCFLRESVFQRLAHPWWHGLAQPRGYLIRAITTAHKGSAKPQSYPFRYSSVRLVQLTVIVVVTPFVHLAPCSRRLRSNRCPFPASPTSGSSNNLREGSLSFGANVSACSPQPIRPTYRRAAPLCSHLRLPQISGLLITLARVSMSAQSHLRSVSRLHLATIRKLKESSAAPPPSRRVVIHDMTLWADSPASPHVLVPHRSR